MSSLPMKQLDDGSFTLGGLKVDMTLKKEDIVRLMVSAEESKLRERLKVATKSLREAEKACATQTKEIEALNNKFNKAVNELDIDNMVKEEHKDDIAALTARYKKVYNDPKAKEPEMWIDARLHRTAVEGLKYLIVYTINIGVKQGSSHNYSPFHISGQLAPVFPPEITEIEKAVKKLTEDRNKSQVDIKKFQSKITKLNAAISDVPAMERAANSKVVQKILASKKKDSPEVAGLLDASTHDGPSLVCEDETDE